MIRAAGHRADAVGFDITILNPALHTDGLIARVLVACLATALDDRHLGEASPL